MPSVLWPQTLDLEVALGATTYCTSDKMGQFLLAGN